MDKTATLGALLLACWGCWEPNPGYSDLSTQDRSPRDLSAADLSAPDLSAADLSMRGAPDLMECGIHPGGGGGGKNRPQVLIRGGLFNMQGLNVTVTDFYMDVYEVTVRAYRDCFANGTGPCSKPATNPYCNWSDAAMGREEHPINCITWTQADAFCRWAGRRLPSEIEWEYAAGGSQKGRYPWGAADPSAGDKPARVCWLPTSLNMGTCPVGSYAKTLHGGPLCLGIADMAGNLWEWTGSEYQDPYASPAIPCRATSSICSLRGGSWRDTAVESLQPARRSNYAPTGVHTSIGARCARTP